MKAMAKLFAVGAATTGALVLSAGVGQGANLTSADKTRAPAVAAPSAKSFTIAFTVPSFDSFGHQSGSWAPAKSRACLPTGGQSRIDRLTG